MTPRSSRSLPRLAPPLLSRRTAGRAAVAKPVVFRVFRSCDPFPFLSYSGVSRHTEHTLGYDVPLNLRCPAAQGEGTGEEVIRGPGIRNCLRMVRVLGDSSHPEDVA